MTTHGAHSSLATASVPPRERNWIRGLVLTSAIVLAILVGVTASGRLVDARAIPAGCVSLATSRADAITTLACVWVALTLLGLGVGRLVNAVVGAFVFGAGLTALTLRSASISGAIFDHASLRAIGMETLIWAVPLTLTLVVIFRLSGPLPDIAPRFGGEAGRRWWREYFDLDAIRSGFVGVLLPLMAWVLVRNMLKGQAFGGACAGGVAVGIAYRLVAPQVTPLFAFIAPVVLMGVYQVYGASRLSVDPTLLFAAGSLPPELRLLPLDTVAGAVTGVAIGLGWARSFRRSDTIAS